MGVAREWPNHVILSEPIEESFADAKESATERKKPAPGKRPQRPWISQEEAIKQTERWLRKHRDLCGDLEIAGEVLTARTNLRRQADATEAVEREVRLSLYDRDRRVTLSPREAGYGLSQFIPVLLACFSRQDRFGREPSGTLLLEEPEAHVHPAMQAELGDVFLEAITRKNHPLAHIICETHSEHLLLRLQRRVREGKLSPNQIAVLYVENLGSESVVRDMPLNERGELIHDWPGGFFQEGLREVLM
ncbi:MAG: AAA family ATPase [Pseudomonadota bacterium]|nr:AAA family ATPase [Pseudomonadota bacterium]